MSSLVIFILRHDPFLHRIKIGRASDRRLGEEKWSVHRLVGSDRGNVRFSRIPNVLNYSVWDFISLYAYVVSADVPVKVQCSFVAEN